MKKNLIFILVAAIVIVGAGAFYGGMKYSQTKQSQNGLNRNGNGANFQRMGQVGMQGGPGITGGAMARNRGGNFINGEIIKKDDKTITVKLPDGGSKIIYVTEKTSYGKFVEGSEKDLEVGKTIMVNGTSNQDGSLLAQTVQMRPAMPPTAGQATSTQK